MSIYRAVIEDSSLLGQGDSLGNLWALMRKFPLGSRVTMFRDDLGNYIFTGPEADVRWMFADFSAYTGLVTVSEVPGRTAEESLALACTSHCQAKGEES